MRSKLRVTNVLEGRAGSAGHTIEQELAKALQKQSVKLPIDPADIIELVKFLADKHAQPISGQAFATDGDWKSTQRPQDFLAAKSHS